MDVTRPILFTHDRDGDEARVSREVGNLSR